MPRCKYAPLACTRTAAGEPQAGGLTWYPSLSFSSPLHVRVGHLHQLALKVPSAWSSSQYVFHHFARPNSPSLPQPSSIPHSTLVASRKRNNGHGLLAKALIDQCRELTSMKVHCIPQVDHMTLLVEPVQQCKVLLT